MVGGMHLATGASAVRQLSAHDHVESGFCHLVSCAALKPFLPGGHSRAPMMLLLLLLLHA